ncbi:hypothetical protein [Microbulbifer sp. YPW1]|uniref:hypothetical protein n=1 Tax=Microbulbifer sp. YPW1 TaxID=2745199 RepID=UPI001597B1C5|nr:hypothetical protein [Microbulbifer sp. YPW1]QKX18764.1 hypothetical protein HUW35_18330 [Microbulbifer sp. YPW1]
MPDCRIALFCFLLLPLLPSCSLMPTQQQTLEGFSPETVDLAREQSANLDKLQALETKTPTQRRLIDQLRTDLQQFERSAIRTANRLEQQGDWHGAEQVLTGAARVLPSSEALLTARQQLAERRRLREARVRMELEIHRGEQLLKDTEAYQRLRQLKGPGVLTWLELKNFQRKRRASAESLQEHAELAMTRKDYSLAQHALTIAKGLYGDDLQQDEDQRGKLERDLARANQALRQQKRKTAITSQKNDSRKQAAEKRVLQTAIADLEKTLGAGDLINARHQLAHIQAMSPQHPKLPSLQREFQTQLNSRIEAAIKRGNDLYSQGNIERALHVWRDARVLDPNNLELQANIARAEKVLQNLRALSTP